MFKLLPLPLSVQVGRRGVAPLGCASGHPNAAGLAFSRTDKIYTIKVNVCKPWPLRSYVIEAQQEVPPAARDLWPCAQTAPAAEP